MLQYTLVENLLTPAPGDFMAQPVNVRSYTLAEIIRRIQSRNTGLSEAQLTASINEFIEEVGLITEEGDTVNTPLVNTNLSIPGVFDGAADSYDGKRHRTRINANAGARLTIALTKVKPQKVEVPEPAPHILETKDIVSDTVNETLTPGGVLQLRGSRLRFLPAEAGNGVFLVNEQGKETQLTVVAENKPSRTILLLPADLSSGTYWVEVRSSSSVSGKPTKTLKTGRFAKTLTV
jgi:hypothetical protein